MTTGTTTTKAENLKTWLETKPYWEQFLWKLHVEKEGLEESDIEKCFQYLLEDSKVIKKAAGRSVNTFPVFDLEDIETPKSKFTLDKIENLKNVNAIDDSCVIEFGKNLTIIYGDNGAGKSGVGRLLSNACLSRKPRRLLPNAKTATSPVSIPSADFHITDTSGQKVINYALGQVNEALKSFSVFDHECALIHLNSENKVEFIPSKIKIFDEVFKSITAIEALLQREAEARQQDDPTEGIFSGTSPVTEFLDSISHATTEQKMEDALKFVQADKTLLAEKKKELAKKLKQDVTAQKKLLQEECRDLENFKNTLTTKSTTILTKTRETQINTILKDIRNKKEIADKLSAKSFEFDSFKNIGSPEWKSLILAAQKLHEKEIVSSEGVEPSHCLLCRQTLTGTEKTLFGDYWKFIKSTAETELAAARRTLASYLDTLKAAETGLPTFPVTDVAVKILKKEAPTDLNNIKTSFDNLSIQLKDWINKIKNEKDVKYTDPKIDLNPITVLVADKKKIEGKLVDPRGAIKTLNGEIAYLQQKQQASRLISKLKKYVEWLRWENAVSGINLSAVRGNNTRKKTEIMSELVMFRYVTIFNEETEKLDCNFGLEVGSHGRDSSTIKGLKLNFAKGYNPSDILSEGEQTVSALADFLTEAKLDKNNSGIIFDDPVNSLDHARRTTIARRLIEEAKERQVIVLTHDIVFLLDLQFYADNESVDNLAVTMRRNGDRVGVIKKELPWFALNVKSRVGYLKNDLVRIKKLESGDQDEYRKEVKGWYELLREAWERAVEERLFKGVVQRFNKAVMTLKLDKVVVTPELIKEITNGMSESSKWLHDMGAGMNPTVPNNAKLTAELEVLEDFIVKCPAS